MDPVTSEGSLEGVVTRPTSVLKLVTSRLLLYSPMPSVRLRAGSAYSTLRDPPVSKRPSLATVFAPHVESLAPTGPSNGPALPRMQRSLPTLRPQSPLLDVPPPLPIGRSRSGTTTSRIQSYISSSRRYSRPAGLDDSRSSLVHIASPTTTDIDSEAPSSAIRSISGLRNSEDDFANLRRANGSLGSDLHHDEVVEHLDVIGEPRHPFCNLRH